MSGKEEGPNYETPFAGIFPREMQGRTVYISLTAKWLFFCPFDCSQESSFFLKWILSTVFRLVFFFLGKKWLPLLAKIMNIIYGKLKLTFKNGSKIFY